MHSTLLTWLLSLPRSHRQGPSSPPPFPPGTTSSESWVGAGGAVTEDPCSYGTGPGKDVSSTLPQIHFPPSILVQALCRALWTVWLPQASAFLRLSPV